MRFPRVAPNVPGELVAALWRLLDVTMPDLSGDQVLEELRRRRADLKVLLCSGYAEEEMQQRFSSQDMASFLQKPYTRKALGTRLKHLLGALTRA